MQEPKKQRDLPPREKSFQELERERIYGEYDKAHPKQVEITDPDDPRYYLDAEEMREFDQKKLAEEKGKTWLDNSRETRERIIAAKTAPEEEAAPDYDDGRPVAHRALDRLIEQHPQYATGAWKEVVSTALHSNHPDIFLLRNKVDKTDKREDHDRLLARSAEIGPGEKAERDRRAAFDQIARQRMAQRGM